MNRDVRDMIDKIIEFEGGYVNSPSDPGGATIYGISAKFNPDVKEKITSRTLTKDEAAEIYYKKYFLGSTAEYLYKAGYKRLAFFFFDCIISGQTESFKFLQRFLNLLGCDLMVDGKIGRKSLQAIISFDRDLFESAFLKVVLINSNYIGRKQSEKLLAFQEKNGMPKYDYTLGFTNRLIKRTRISQEVKYV